MRSSCQVVMPGIDHGDADAFAGVAERFLYRARADRHRRAVDVRLDRTIEVHAEDLALARQLLQQVVRQLEEHSVDDVQAVVDAVDSESGCVALEFARQLMAWLEFDNDPRRVHASRCDPWRGFFQRVVKMVVLSELAGLPWFLDRAMRDVPAVGRSERCKPEQQQQGGPHDPLRSPDGFSSDVRGTQLSSWPTEQQSNGQLSLFLRYARDKLLLLNKLQLISAAHRASALSYRVCSVCEPISMTIP